MTTSVADWLWGKRHRATCAVVAAVTVSSPLDSQPARHDSLGTLRVATEATTRFLTRWRTEWLKSDWEAWAGFQATQGVRTASTMNAPPQQEHLACIYAWAPPVGLADPSRNRNRIGSASGFPALICPGWTVENPNYADASIVLDSAITPDRRRMIAAARDSLLLTLATAATGYPGDAWITGQRVRFLLDQSYVSATYASTALDVARACRGDRWYCESLAGLVFSRQRMVDSASAAFARAQAAAGSVLLCQMADVTALMDRHAVPREFVLPTACPERMALSARYWWLADPLWSDGVNERRVEHDARTIALLLASSLSRAERFDWSIADGGDAAAQLVTRYGWPSRMVWSAINQGRVVGTPPNQTRIRYRTGIDPFEAAPSPPFTTQEYNFGRVHLGPSWSALIAPFSSRSSDWEFSAPPAENPRRWWPSEHMQRDRPLVAVTEWQEQYWRRPDSIKVAVAARVPLSLSGGGPFKTEISAILMRSPGPEVAVPVARQRLTGDSSIVLSGTIPSDSALLSLELTSTDIRRGDARVRFAINNGLSALSSGAIALSTPALLRVVPGTEPATYADNAVSYLLPTTTLQGTRRVGAFWESYGFADTAAVDITVQVHRLGSPGRFERIAASLGLNDRESTGTEIRWREPRAGTPLPAASSLAIHGRSVLLNLAGLRAGAYVVAVTLRTLDGRSASSIRHFELE